VRRDAVPIPTRNYQVEADTGVELRIAVDVLDRP
jgi:hypothetical protein